MRRDESSPLSSRRVAALAALALALLCLAGCASAPRSDGPPRTPAADRGADRDGPGRDIPPGLARIPDAEPRIEPVKPGGANKPYQVAGRDYVPIVRDTPFRERGLASWYGRKFHGRRTASGEVYDMYAMTAAHPTLPIPSYARIRNPANGKEVLVRINDRGPFHSERIVDLSYAAALKLDLLRGVAPVELERLTFDDIRAGLWRKGEPLAETTTVAAGPSPPSAAIAPTAPTAPTVPTALLVPNVLTASTASTASTPPIAAAAEPADTPAAEPIAELATPMRSFTTPARGFWIQLGAFRERTGAETLQRRVVAEIERLAPLLATFSDAALYRVQAGPYPNRDEARSAAERIREALGLVPVIVERR